MESFKMYFAESFDEASTLLLEHQAKPISGGTALTTMMKEGIFKPETLINLRPLRRSHNYVTAEGNEVRIGALTPLRTIERSDEVKESLPVVADCLSKIASIRVRNVATIGGNIAHADPDLDLPPVLAGLEASIVIHGPDGERVVPFDEFVQGYYQTDLGEGELVKEVRIPTDTGKDSVYMKHRSLSEADWPCVGVAAFADPSGANPPEVYLNSVGDTPMLAVEGLEEVFDGQVTEEQIQAAGELAENQCDPIGDARGSAEYKRRMAGEFTERALRDVLGIDTTIKVI